MHGQVSMPSDSEVLPHGGAMSVGTVPVVAARQSRGNVAGTPNDAAV